MKQMLNKRTAALRSGPFVAGHTKPASGLFNGDFKDDLFYRGRVALADQRHMRVPREKDCEIAGPDIDK